MNRTAYQDAIRDCLAARFGAPAALEPAEVDWDRRFVCRATLADGRRVVVKADQDRVRHHREVTALAAAWQAGAPVPELLWLAERDYWIAVLAEIPTRASLRTGAPAWRAAGAAARALHETPIPAETRMFCEGGEDWTAHLLRRIDLECELAVTRGLFARSEADAVRRYTARALSAAGPIQPALLHGDLQARHVLVDGDRVVLVDFGDAGWGDPALDLVVLTHLDLDRRDEVLAGYGANAALRARIDTLGATYSLWRNMFVSRWYFENAFEQQRNTQVAREVLEAHVLPAERSYVVTAGEPRPAAGHGGLHS